MFEATVSEGVCRLSYESARWLATGWDGGYHTGDGAYNVSVPTGFEQTNLDSYTRNRIEKAGFTVAGPRLLTGVDIRHARGARQESVVAVVTAGISNPARLSVGESGDGTANGDGGESQDDRRPPGTVNVLVGTTRALDDGTLATLLATAVEAKTATLQQVTGFSGTTTDAVAVGCNPAGDTAEFAGSGTAVGNATRACVRDALVASLDARYPDGSYPRTIADAEHGIVTAGDTTLFCP